MTTKSWQKKPTPRCLLCGGAKGNIQPQTIDNHEFFAHPTCRGRLDDEFILWFIENTIAMRRGEERK